jgi:hypothetical protein
VIVIVLGLLSKESYEITSSHPQVRGEPLPQPREGGANWRLFRQPNEEEEKIKLF